MLLECPDCGQEHNIDAAKITFQKFNAVCKSCHVRFVVNLISCPGCDHKQLSRERCESCGTALSTLKEEELLEDIDDASSPDVPTAAGQDFEPPRIDSEAEDFSGNHSAAKNYIPEFTGTAGEFFRIWIVNLALTIVTFGIYTAWAKVRTRKYFYANTRLAGHSFDYTADPKTLLKGYLIVGSGFLLYSFTGQFMPVASVVIAIVFALILPVLLYKSLRFFARNSLYRNIRFRFLGTKKESYIVYMLFPVLIPLSFGFIFPYWFFRQKKYFYNNIAFGTTASEFNGESKSFYKIFSMVFLIALVPLLLLTGAAVLIPRFAAKAFVAAGPGNAARPDNIAFIAAALAGYLVMLAVVTLLQQYLFARLSNYCWNNCALGTVRFKSTLKARRLMWIRFTNILAMVFSLGFLAPWAKIRRTRYILRNLTVIAGNELDGFMAGSAKDESGLGEATTDFFDFEVGL